MSKKKATMTLKDFHGGSIPSDIPLPSAPGVIVRNQERGGVDRQRSWGNPMGRSKHQLRPAAAGSARKLDDKTPFLSNSVHIGCHFDEDERKPLDGVSGPRLTVTDEGIRGQSGHISRASLGPVSRFSGGTNGVSDASNELHDASVNGQSYARSCSSGSSYPITGVGVGPHPNAWGMRKETASVKELVSAAKWSAPDAAAKLAHASALEKVSSGRWNTKQYHNTLDAVSANEHTKRQPGFAGPAIGDQAPDRPKLNLKPRSHPQEGNPEAKRVSAHQREVVLQERGINDVAGGKYKSPPPFRVKDDSPSSRAISSTHVAPSRHGEKVKNTPVEQRTIKFRDRRDHRLDGERTDSKRRNRQNETWKNNRGFEKHRNGHQQQQQQQLRDRAPSPDTWRKPIEHPKPTSHDAPLRYGKVASALELAQAFSKPASDSQLSSRLHGHQALPSQGHTPFSRLMGPTPRPQINGY